MARPRWLEIIDPLKSLELIKGNKNMQITNSSNSSAGNALSNITMGKSLCCILTALGILHLISTSVTAKPPNVIVIYTDDQGTIDLIEKKPYSIFWLLNDASIMAKGND